MNLFKNQVMRYIISACAFLIAAITIKAQQYDFSGLAGRYLGQSEPGIKPELFAPGLVSTGQGVHGNIVFTADFSEAAWHPNNVVNGRALIYIMKYRNERWEAPVEFYPKSGSNYSEPFYSYDGKRLYYLSGQEDASGNAENEKIYYVERKDEGWSDPILLSENIPAFHWQFSLDRNNNLYFGGSSKDQKGEIYFSEFKDGEYLNPVLLPERINSGSSEFSPFIAPDNSYLVFTRMLEKEKAPPQMNLFVSFKDADGKWTMAQNLTEKIGLPVQAPFVMMSAARVSPDGRFLFFCFFNGTGHMVYWVSTRIIEELKPKV
jgi:Tol biopolymer transport system component